MEIQAGNSPFALVISLNMLLITEYHSKMQETWTSLTLTWYTGYLSQFILQTWVLCNLPHWFLLFVGHLQATFWWQCGHSDFPTWYEAPECTIIFGLWGQVVPFVEEKQVWLRLLVPSWATLFRAEFQHRHKWEMRKKRSMAYNNIVNMYVCFT